MLDMENEKDQDFLAFLRSILPSHLFTMGFASRLPRSATISSTGHLMSGPIF